MNVIFGIDYGSKYTGNTVIAILQDKDILFLEVDKQVDADEFIFNAARHFSPSLIFIDCPLSLPGIYTKVEGCTNYHFREADKELKAMSPMFLGGMVARAMELTDRLTALKCEVLETYPKVLAHQLKLKGKGYKGSSLGLKDCKRFMEKMLESDYQIDVDDITSWHHFDALLSLLSAIRHVQGKSHVYGSPQEGEIVV
jgi:predicted nuclease with RNAse H fold